ncbi:MAG: DUF4329 domain-containing protein, partial [Pseudomonadales bacterium]
LPTVDTRLAHGEFESILYAVQSAGRQYHEPSRRTDREYVGGILKNNDGRYRYTAGHAESRDNAVSFRVSVQSGYRLVAFWHTHGRPGRARELFSAKDANLVTEQGLPFYLITPTGCIRVMEPGRARPVRPRQSVYGRRGAAAGVIVGRIR